jgi:hypothetical protein
LLGRGGTNAAALGNRKWFYQRGFWMMGLFAQEKQSADLFKNNRTLLLFNWK